MRTSQFPAPACPRQLPATKSLPSRPRAQRKCSMMSVMCGRYASARDPIDLGDLLGVNEVESTTAADFNIAPTKPVHLVFERAAEPQPVRVLSVAVWDLGLARDRNQPLFNVRSESVRERFASALSTRRCLI